MNYQAHYDRLIMRARERALDGYVERHHILPRCLGGTNARENLVDLTAEEHFTAHLMLVKIHPQHSGLLAAAVMMTRRCRNNKDYGWLRRRYSGAISRAMSGVKKSSAHRAKIGAAHKGRPKSDQQRARLSAALLGRRMPPGHGEKVSKGLGGIKKSAAHREKIRIALLGNTNGLGKKLPPRSPEHCAKISAAKRARDARSQAETVKAI